MFCFSELSVSVVNSIIYQDDESINSSPLEEGKRKQQDDLAPYFKKEMITQLTLYNLAFIFIYMPLLVGTTIMLVSQVKIPYVMFLVIVKIMNPLGGVFNILIYTRPATRVMQKRFSISWLKAFYLVINNGGTATCTGNLITPQGEDVDNHSVRCATKPLKYDIKEAHCTVEDRATTPLEFKPDGSFGARKDRVQIDELQIDKLHIDAEDLDESSDEN